MEGSSLFSRLSLPASSQVARLCPACLSASLPGGSTLLVPACCFMGHCVTDLMTCDLTVHLDTQEFTWLFIFVLLCLNFHGLSQHLTCKPLCSVC